jgi:phosphotransferase family enzyme
MQDGTAALMADTLQEGLSGLRGRALRIQKLHRGDLLDASSFHTERLELLLEGGNRLPVFFKDLNPEHQVQEARRLRKGDISPSQRELLMYQSILSHERFGTPQLYAFRWEPARGIYWLFLEDAGSSRLSKCGDIDCWLAAAKWAARFHAAARRLSPSRIHFLPEFDRSHYRHCAEHIQCQLSEFAAEECELVCQALERYVPLIDWLSDLPRKLIHGEFFGKNIMLRSGSSNQLITVTDWESAAFGPCSLDLVSLTSGRWSAVDKERMWRAYFEQYQADTGRELDWGAFCHELRGVALYHALTWLGWWARQSRSHHFSRWVRELKEVLENDIAGQHRRGAAQQALQPSPAEEIT